jgi:hypothetical protein
MAGELTTGSLQALDKLCAAYEDGGHKYGTLSVGDVRSLIRAARELEGVRAELIEEEACGARWHLRAERTELELETRDAELRAALARIASLEAELAGGRGSGG